MKKQIFKDKKNFSELKNDFIGLKDGELKDRELITIKNSRNICSTIYCVYVIQIDLKKKKWNRKVLLKNTLYNWLTN